MQIYLILQNGKSVLFDISLDVTVEKLKSKIMEKYGTPIETQLLFFGDQYLENQKSLRDCGIAAESKVTVHTFKSRDDQTQSKLKQSEQKNSQLLIELEKTKEEIMNIKKNLQEANQMNQILQNEIQDNEMKLESLQNELKAKNNEIIQLKTSKDIEDGMEKSRGSNNEEFFKLTSEIQILKMEVTGKDREIYNFQNQITDLKEDKMSLQVKCQELSKMKEELFEKKYEVRSLMKEMEMMKNQLIESKESLTGRDVFLQQEIQSMKAQNKKLQEKIEELADQNKAFELEKVRSSYMQSTVKDKSQEIDEYQRKINDKENEINSQKQEIQRLTLQINSLKDSSRDAQTQQMRQLNESERAQQEKIFSLQTQMQQLKNDLQVKSQAFEESQLNVSKFRKDAYEKEKKFKEFEDSIENLKKLLQEKDKKYKELEKQLREAQDDLDSSKNEISFYKKQINQLKSNLGVQKTGNTAIQEMDAVMLDYENLQKEKQLRKQQEMEAEERKKSELVNRAKQIESEQEQRKQLLQQEKGQRVKQAKFLQQQMMNSHGKIEVCFLVDVTASMDPYKESAMKCINQSMISIKDKTNRDAIWSCVAYQDFAELKQLGGLYRQVDFTSDAKRVQDFMNSITCQGGGDFAEDIRGGIKQMVSNLAWSKAFKIAMLICDAPTHGKRYSGGVTDRHPNEDIEDAIKLLIENNIFFVGILFNKSTFTMFEEIKKIYKEYDKEELLLMANLENTSEGRIWEELVNLVSQASMRATQTNNKGTKTKNAQLMKKSQDGAMEALCKTLKNPFDFDKQPGVKVIDTQFQVYRVEIKQEAFEEKIEFIEKISLPNDYMVYKEGSWKCVRTEKPFAFGQMKSVYLMKRQGKESTELYVIKMPLGDKTYQTIEEAMSECRSHLVSKCLMKKFFKDLKAQRDIKNTRLKFKEIAYSDFLILQESEKSFWIAERYFSGEFVKYNNNYGFISDEDNEINHLAQAFTYYTFFISNFNYMVSDVQGVGLYFTDPAVNTKSGKFDETDMGLDGQSMFMVAYQGKRHLGQVFLELLGIKLD